MRVLIVGESAPGALADSYSRGFEALGVEVVRYSTNQAVRSAIPGSGTRAGQWLLRGHLMRHLNRRVVEELDGMRVDLVLVIKGATFSAETIRRVRQKLGAPVVNFYPDDPFSTLASNRLVFGVETLAAYDACYTFARHLMPEYRQAGVEQVQYLPFARDPALHAPVENADKPDFDIVFVGNLDAERVRWLEAVSGFRVAIFGANTRAAVPARSSLHRASFFPEVYGKDLARALTRGAVSLNVLRLQNQGSHNMRSFESPACGAFTLSQRTEELTDLFREEEEVAFFGSEAELVRQVERWLACPAERAEVARAGFRRVENDTYRHRAEQILDTMRCS